MHGLDYSSVERLENALINIETKTHDLKDLPCQAKLLTNFLWFQQQKFPFYKHLLDMHKKYSEMDEYYSNMLLDGNICYI